MASNQENNTNLNSLLKKSIAPLGTIYNLKSNKPKKVIPKISFNKLPYEFSQGHKMLYQ
jgi:hypothetical protein